MARRLGPYAPLSASYYVDDAIIEAGEDAELLYVRMLAFCAGRIEQDGYVTPGQIKAVASPLRRLQKRIDSLVRVGLWEPDDGGYIVRAWLKWNPSADDLGKSKAKDRGRKAAITVDVRAMVYSRDGHACSYCSATDNLCIDHVKPQHHGGGHEESNLQTLCQACNQRKGARDGTGMSREQARESYGITYGNPVPSPRDSRSRGGASAVIVTKAGTESLHSKSLHPTPAVTDPVTAGSQDGGEDFEELKDHLHQRGLSYDWTKVGDDDRARIIAVLAVHGPKALATEAYGKHDANRPTRYAHALLGMWEGMRKPGERPVVEFCTNTDHPMQTLPCSSCAGDAKAGAA